MKKEIEESEKVRFEHGEAPGQTSFPNLHSPAAASTRQKTPSSNALMGANLAKSGAIVGQIPKNCRSSNESAPRVVFS